VILFSFVAPLVLAAATAVPPPLPADVSGLGWMEGRWTGTKDGLAMEEIWTSPAGGALVGLHKDVKGARVSFEFLRIAVAEGGGVTYFAMPRGASATPFALVEASGERAVFENKEHDFPQRILYWREGERLHARIEGTLKGKPASEEWSWTRAR
jgi:hypothetical protein